MNEALIWTGVFLVALVIGIWLLNKLSTRKANDYNKDANHNVSQIHEDNNNHL